MKIYLKESQLRKAEHILDCSRNDNLASIREKRRILCTKYHPDKAKGDEEKAKEIISSFEYIKSYQEGQEVINDCFQKSFFAQNVQDEKDELVSDLEDFIYNELGVQQVNVNRANQELKSTLDKFFNILNDDMVNPFLSKFLFKDKNTKQKTHAKAVIHNIFNEAKDKIKDEGKKTIINYINTVFGWNFKMQDFEAKSEPTKKKKVKSKVVDPDPPKSTEKTSSLKYKIAITSYENLVDLSRKKRGNYPCFVESELTGISVNKFIYLYLIDKKNENNKPILICRDKSDIIYKVSCG